MKATLSSKAFSMIFLGACLIASTACTSMPTVNQDPARNNQATYNKDLKECREDYPELGSGVHYRQWINCMKLKGWQ